MLSPCQHVSYTSRACRFHLRNISRIRKYIPQDISIVLIKSLVMSRLDYSNGFVVMDSLNVLFLACKRFLNSAAAYCNSGETARSWLLCPVPWWSLHWLPVDKRIEYKLLLYTYKALHGLAPGYLCKLLVPYEPWRVIRSAESNLLTVPPGKPGKYGSRSFVRAICESMRLELRGREGCLALKIVRL